MAVSIVTRCPWCTARMKEAAASCAQCGCDRIDASDYGVARMLRDAGVDRIALPQRVRTLDHATRDKLEGAWDAQSELVRALREDAVTAARHLPARDELLAIVDDELARAIPVVPAQLGALRWSRPFSEERLMHLELVRQRHPIARVRDIATLAAAREGGATRDVVSALMALVWDEGAVGAVAAVVLLGWRVGRAGALGHHGGDFDKQLRACLTRARAIATLEAEAAVALTALTPSARGLLEEPLRAALASNDPELRLGAALALDDARTLAKFLDQEGTKDDDERKDVALDALCALGSSLLASRLVPLAGMDEDAPVPPDGARVRLLERLHQDLEPALHEAVMVCARTGSDRVRSAALRVLMRGRFVARDPQEQAALTHLVATHARALGADAVVKLLAWVSADAAPDETLRPYVHAAAQLLRDEPPETATQEPAALRALLLHADKDDLAALDRCMLEPAMDTRLDHDPARIVMEAALDLHARGHERRGAHRERLPALLARFWALTPRPVRPIARALEKRQGMSGAEDVITFFWRRFTDAPAEDAQERQDVIEAVRPWSQRFLERRDATPAHERPDGGDPTRAWELWSRADPENMWRLVDTLKAQVTDDALARFTTSVLDAAAQVVDHKPRTAIVTAFRVCAEVANRFRAQEPSGALDDAVDVLHAHLPAFLARFDAADATEAAQSSERGAAHFKDDIATELRLIDETRARRQESAERERARIERERQREQERLEREAQARERERLAQEEREREALEAQRHVEALQASVIGIGGDAPSEGPRLPQPAFVRDGLDDEPYLPGPGPRTVLQYAQLMKALQGGHDALQVFAAFGLDVTTWPACATRWSELMMRDPQVGMRFAQLLSLPWR